MLGFTTYSAAAFSDLGSSEELLVVTGVAATTAVGSVLVKGNQSGLTLGSVEGSASVNAVTVAADATTTFATSALNADTNSVTIAANSTTAMTGVVGTGQIGSLSITANAGFAVTGVRSSTTCNTQLGTWCRSGKTSFVDRGLGDSILLRKLNLLRWLRPVKKRRFRVFSPPQ